MKRSAPLMRRSALPPSTRPIRRKRRTVSEFARIYGSRARVRWIKSLPCIVHGRGCAGEIVNAHTENGGLARKGPYWTIVPACDRHHRAMHAGIETFAATYGVDPRVYAAVIEIAWQALNPLNPAVA